MCEHEWITAIGHRGEHGKLGKVVCWNCGKTKDEIDLEQQLAAANARIAELEKSNKKWSIVVDDLKQLSETDKQCAEQAEAQAAAMRLRFEKYVRDNCKLIRHSVADGLGKPDDVEGKCGGYAQNGDEPHYICQECVAAYDPEDEYNENVIAAGSALLAELQRYREALEVLSKLGNGDSPGNSDGNRIAQAALEEPK